MNICVCSAGELYGGVEEWIYSFACQVRKTAASHHLSVLLFHDGVLAEKLRAAGVELFIVRGHKYNIGMIGAVARLLRDQAIDVVHTHGYKANIVCALAARKVHVPVVKTEHSRIEPFRTVAEWLAHLRMSCSLVLDTMITRACVQRIVFVSQFVANHYARAYRTKITEIITNGIVVPAVSDQRPEGISADQFNIGIVGRISVVKGHRYLFDAVAELACPRMMVHVFGEGALKDELTAYCAKKNITSQVRFWGFKEDINTYIAAMDVFAMPSLFESMPYALLQAMYVRVPVLASKVGGIPEIIENGVEGILVPPENGHALAEGIGLLYKDRERGQRLARAAHEKVVRSFLIDRMVEKYMTTYSALL